MFLLKMAKNLLVANIGLGKSKNSKNAENRTQTFARLHDSIWKATQEVGSISLMAIQELGDCKFVPAPFFGPTATDDSHLMDDDNSKARGVGIYARSNCYTVFNSESRLDFGDRFTEIHNADLYHKHNTTTRKTKIDRVFSNFSNEVRIEAVLPSIEAVNKNDEESKDLGHKVYVIQIGRKAISTTRPSRESIVSIKNLKKEAKRPVNFREYDAKATKELPKHQRTRVAEELAADLTHRMIDAAE